MIIKYFKYINYSIGQSILIKLKLKKSVRQYKKVIIINR